MGAILPKIKGLLQRDGGGGGGGGGVIFSPSTVQSSVCRYQPILHTLYYTLHTEHAYCLSYRFLNNVVITTVIEMVETV